ncbi:EF-hand calcium-binding domain-containing protein 12-like [Crassostrea virginica]
MPPRHRAGPVDLTDADISYPMNRLFDEYNLDHIPVEDRLSLFKQRDLAHVKHYKAAVKIFGGPLSRKRIMVAPPMETPLKHRLGVYHGRKSPPLSPPVLNSDLKEQIPVEQKPSEEEMIAERETQKEKDYKNWMKERQGFRNDLENMGLSERWLNQKPSMTALEKRVLVRMIKERTPHYEPPPVVPETPTEALIHDVPNVKIPAPLGIRILEEHLRKNKMRLIDLFVSTDKDKDWKITRDEFRKVIQESKVPMSEALLEDMILSLDLDYDNNLDYKELAKGLSFWKKERRENRRKQISRESTMDSMKSRSSSSTSVHAAKMNSSDETVDENLASESDEKILQSFSPSRSNQNVNAKTSKMSSSPPLDSSRKSVKSSRKSESEKTSTDRSQGSKSPKQGSVSKPENQTTGLEGGDNENKGKQVNIEIEVTDTSKEAEPKRSRSATPQYLSLPEQDIKPEHIVMSSDEAMVDLRKRDREALKTNMMRMSAKKLDEGPGIIKVGDKAIDDHCMQSTLEGEIGGMVDKFRQLKLREFYEINKLCSVQGVSLSPSLLEKVLLYPPDIPHSFINKQVKTPGAPLLSSHYADPPKRPRTPIEVKHKDRVRRSQSGRLLIDSRHRYPQGRSVAASGSRANLSTGKAIIRRKVDCWMSFEEYDRLTRHLAIRYQQLHGSSDSNAFWPGQLLDKLRLCMPPYDKPELPDQSGIMFHNVKDRKLTNLGKARDYSAWPVNEKGFVQSGIYDPFARKYIHNY